MSITGTDSTILYSFIKQIKKLTISFTEETLSKEIPILEGIILNNKKEIDYSKFYPGDKYYFYLLTYLIINSIKNANKIYNQFQKKYEMEFPTIKINKKRRKIPDNWQIIQGGKK